MALLTTLKQSYPAVVINVSREGCRLRAGKPPALSEELMVAIDRVKTFGTVRWIMDDQFGIQFDEALSIAEMRELRHHVALDQGVRPELRAAMEDWTLGLAR